MRAWKQVNEQDAHFLTSGSLKLGTWADYEALENGRGDFGDSAVLLHSGHLDPRFPDHAAAIRRMMPEFEGVDGIDNFLFVDNTARISSPRYPTFCVSEVGCRFDPSPSQPKATFEVLGLRTLAARLQDLNPDVLGAPVIRRVTYDRVEFNALESDPPPPSPFRKAPRFSEECEIRLAFNLPPGKEPHEGQTVYTEPDTGVASLFRRLTPREIAEAGPHLVKSWVPRRSARAEPRQD